MPSALTGLRALELSSTLAGAQVGQLLADYGAEVVQVEPPGGSPLRAEAAWPFWARGKQSIALDLKRPTDRDVVCGLARELDVLVETWRPGVAERLGLGFEELAAANPRLVYASITGFGRNNPLSKLQGYEGIVMAKLGAFGAHQHLTPRPGHSFIAAPFCSFSAAQLALHGIFAALMEREKSGCGQRVESTLIQGILSHDTWNFLIRMMALKFPGAFSAARPVSKRMVPAQSLAFRLMVGLSRDGRFLQFSQTTDRLFHAFLKHCGLAHTIDDPRWKNGSHEDEAAREEYWEMLLAAVRTKTVAEWSEVFDHDKNVWGELFRSGSELLDHPQMRHDQQVVTTVDPERGPVEQPGPLVKMSATPGCADRPAPRLNEHAAELRARAARAESLGAVALSPSDRPPLEGVTVLELGTFYAAPYGATVLADLGARVIKVEEPSGDPIRTILAIPELGGVKVLMGKESVAVDVSTPAGRDIVHALAKRADVVLRSYRAGVAERLGVDAATLLKINPDLVYLDAPGYGTDGPCGLKPAFAPTIAAAAGLSMRIVGPSVPERADISLDELKSASIRLAAAGTFIAQSDGFSALGVATAMLLGMLARKNGAPGQRLLTTMLSTVAHALSEDMVRYANRPASPAPDPELFGLSATYRLYASSDGQVFLAVTSEREWRRLVAQPEFSALANDARFRDAGARRENDAAVIAALTPIFITKSGAAWEAQLTAADVACVVSGGGPVEAAVTDPDSLARRLGMVVEVNHPTFETHPRMIAPVQFSRSRTLAGEAPLCGQDTDRVLREIGYEDEQIAALRDAKVIGG